MTRLAYFAGKDWYAWLLPAAFVFLLPFESLLYAPLVIMAIIGLVTFFKQKNYKNCLKNPGYRLLIIAFVLIWLPMLVSLVDAVNPAHSIKTTLSVLPYIFVGFFILDFLDNKETRNRLNYAILFITTFWCIDATIQLFFDENLFGDSYVVKTRLTGIFYPKLTLGLVLVVLLPVVLEQSRKLASSNTGLFIAILIASLHIAIIILSGSRTSLVMLVLAVFGWFVYILQQNKSIDWKKTLLVAGISLPVIAALTLLQPTRFKTLVDIPDADLKTIDKISSYRLPLWEASYHMMKEHWINGIGPRGFRHAYNEFKPEKGKYSHEFKKASTHPHFVLLEIFTETGIIGFTGILILLGLLFTHLHSIKGAGKLDVFPWYLGILIAIVPNVAKAFYSTFWLSIVFFMLFVGIASSIARHEQ